MDKNQHPRLIKFLNPAQKKLLKQSEKMPEKMPVEKSEKIYLILILVPKSRWIQYQNPQIEIANIKIPFKIDQTCKSTPSRIRISTLTWIVPSVMKRLFKPF